MKIIYFLAFILLLACSHHHKDSAHHHHNEELGCKECGKELKTAFNGKCAHAVMEGDTHVAGKEEFNLAHEGQKYFFSSQAKKEQFKRHLNEHVTRAHQQWKKGEIR